MDSAKLTILAIRSLWKRKFSAACIFACTILLVLVGIAVCPRKYRSEAKLFVRLGRETVALDPTATTGQTVAVQSSREIEVRSVRDMLASRVLLEKVVAQMGSEIVLDPPLTWTAESTSGSTQAAKSKWLKQTTAKLREIAQMLHLSDPVPDSDLAIRELEKTLEVDGGPKSSVISVEYISKSPVAAKEVLDAFLDCYRELHVRVNRAPENYKFFETQTNELKQKLLTARGELESLKNEKGVIAIDIRKQNLQEHVSRIDVKIREVEANLASADASLSLSKRALGLIPDRLLTDQVDGLGDPARDSIRNSLYQMEMEAERVKQSYADGHPERERILAQVASMRKIYESEAKERPTQTSTINQAYQEVQLKVIDTEALKAGIVAELKALQKQRTDVQRELIDLNSTEMSLASLQEHVDLLQDNHRQYSENLELSRIDEELRKMQISNVSIVQPPQLILQPVSPNKKLVALGGCILALMNAIGFAMWLNRKELVGGLSLHDQPHSPAMTRVTGQPVGQVADQASGLRGHAGNLAVQMEGGDAASRNIEVHSGNANGVNEDAKKQSDEWADEVRERSAAPR